MVKEEGDGSWLNLLGIVMIDFVCFLVWRRGGSEGFLKIIWNGVVWGFYMKEEMKRKVMRCFFESLRMVGEWELFFWEGRKLFLVIFFRVKDKVFVFGEVEGMVSRVDVCWEDKYLGWDGYRKGLIIKVVDILGYYFNIFSEMENVDVVMEEIGRVCGELEGWYVRRFVSWGEEKR